jgi:hypothetical protein
MKMIKHVVPYLFLSALTLHSGITPQIPATKKSILNKTSEISAKPGSNAARGTSSINGTMIHKSTTTINGADFHRKR